MNQVPRRRCGVRVICLLLLGLSVAVGYSESSPGSESSAGSGAAVSLRVGRDGVTVDFRNRIPGRLDHPVLDENGGRLAGAHYVAQLFRLSAIGWPSEAVPVGEPRPFGTGADAGYWIPAADPRVGVPSRVGCCEAFQVRVWDLRAGETFAGAGSGRRAVSRFFWYFQGSAVQVMENLGLITLEDYEEPALTVSQPTNATVWVATGGEVSRQPLWMSGYVGQLHVQTNIFDPDFFVGLGGVPVGPVAPVRHEAPHAGRWAVDASQIIGGLPVSMARYDRQPGSSYLIQLRVWDGTVGSTYAECLRNGGRTGFGAAMDLVQSSEVFTAFPRLLSAPNTAVLGEILLRAPNRTVTVAPGLGLYANPTTNQVVPQLNLSPFFAEPPPEVLIYHFDASRQNYRMASHYGLWFVDSAPYFAPGEGFFLFNPSTRPLTLLFPGANGWLPSLTRPVGEARFYSRGNTLGRSATWSELTGVVPVDGDAVYRFQAGLWQMNAYTFGAWDQGEPLIPADEAVFIRLQP